MGYERWEVGDKWEMGGGSPEVGDGRIKGGGYKQELADGTWELRLFKWVI